MIKKIKEKKTLNEKRCLEHYLEILKNSCSDFIEIKLAYENACAELGERFEYIDKIIEYNNDMLLLNLRLSFNQGFKDNVEHFAKPNAPTFLDENYDATLKEKEILNNEEYIDIFVKRAKLVSLIPDKENDLYEHIVEYEAFLNTYIPKMAHYYGFISFDNSMKKSNADYKPDYNLNKRYKEWLSDYLDINLE